jgi:hypothetical protein
MIDSLDRNPAPKRIAMGGEACTIIHNVQTERLPALESQKDIAFATNLAKIASHGSTTSNRQPVLSGQSEGLMPG